MMYRYEVSYQALVAQGIEQRIPVPCAGVRILSSALFIMRRDPLAGGVLMMAGENEPYSHGGCLMMAGQPVPGIHAGGVLVMGGQAIPASQLGE